MGVIDRKWASVLKVAHLPVNCKETRDSSVHKMHKIRCLNIPGANRADTWIELD